MKWIPPKSGNSLEGLPTENHLLMNRQTVSPELTRSYLLGELDPEARRQLEETLMVEEEYYKELLIAEDELIDRYLSGGLDAHEQERFLQHFLTTPGRRQKLDFARTFQTYVTNHTPQPSAPERGGREPRSDRARLLPLSARGYHRALRLTFTAAMLVAVLGGSWVLWKRWQQPAPSGGAEHRVLVVSLSPILTRSVGADRPIFIPANITTVQLQLEPTVGGQESYSAKLLTDEGREVYNANALTAKSDGSVVFAVPAELLEGGDYRVKLEGSKGGATEGAGIYHFRAGRE
ncbi:MAG TPA: hypothetical protein VGB76_11715 [Pyrinomonadaceae bacterium]